MPNVVDVRQVLEGRVLDDPIPPLPVDLKEVSPACFVVSCYTFELKILPKPMRMRVMPMRIAMGKIP